MGLARRRVARADHRDGHAEARAPERVAVGPLGERHARRVAEDAVGRLRARALHRDAEVDVAVGREVDLRELARDDVEGRVVRRVGGARAHLEIEEDADGDAAGAHHERLADAHVADRGRRPLVGPDAAEV